jgi:calmodulin
MSRLTSDQLEDVKQAFNLYSKGKEKIATSELGALIRAVGRNPTERQVAELQRKIDPTNSGQISFNQFLSVLDEKPFEGDIVDLVKDCFKLFDKDGNGFVSVSELRHVLTTLGEKLTTEEVDSLLRDAEVNEEGNLNYEMFVAQIMPKN